MPELILPKGIPQPKVTQELALQSVDHQDIPNSWDAMITDPYQRAGMDGLRRSLMANEKVRALTGPSNRYNCHGLVFASRRCNLDSPLAPVDIRELLRRDGFTEILEPQTGDIVTYLSGNQVDHSGIVSRVERLSAESLVRLVFIWSMWGALGEFEHPVNISPYSDCSVKYWRLTNASVTK